jgi:hypothetical protein
MKETKNIFLKVIVWSVTGFGAFYLGDNLVSGESLATIDNIIAGGSIGISQALLLGVMLFQNVLPEKTANHLRDNVVPVVQELEQKTDIRFNNVESKLDDVLAILMADKELRDKLLNIEE